MTGPLDRLAALEAAATSAPWDVLPGARGYWISGGLGEPDGGWPVCDMEVTGARIPFEEPDAALIAAARNALPALIAGGRMLQALEWSAGDYGDECPNCGEDKSDGHHKDCALGHALAALEASGE